MRLNAGQVVVEILETDDFTCGRATGRVADHGGAAAAKGNWAVPHPLQGGEQHDADHVPGMKRCSGGVEADVGRDWSIVERRPESSLIRDVVDESPLAQIVDRIDALLAGNFRGTGVRGSVGHGLG